MLQDIIIGAIGSVIATLMIWILSCAWDARSKSRVLSCLRLMEQYSWIIQNRYSYPSDYPEIVRSSEQMLLLIRELFDSMKWLNRLRVGRLFFTLLYDMQRRCEKICLQTIGYDGADELSARIRRIESEQFYSCGDDVKEMYIAKEIKMLEKCYDNKYPVVSFEIEINSFKTGNKSDAPIQKQGMTVAVFDKKCKTTRGD